MTHSLSDIARACGDLVVRIDGDAATSIAGASNDSTRVKPGDLFFCIAGLRADGHSFASDAAGRGASALCVERRLEVDLPQLIVTDSRRALGRIAALIHGYPARDLMLLGVTGTNGKTTTAFLLESILRADGRKTGLLGTIETRIGEEVRPGVRTTPDALELHELLADMRSAGVGAVSLEVTSHALTLHRVEGLVFAAAAFTNLSQDHLDFHADLEDYFAAKRSLFVPERVAGGAVNVDDAYGRRLAEEAAVPIVSYGTSADAGLRAADVRSGPWGQELVVVVDSPGLPQDDIKISTSLVGAFNVANCLAACGTALIAGIDPGAIADGIADVKSVPGRFEAIDMGQPFAVVVDYAHTPDSLDNVLREARLLADHLGGRVLCVFGCGGDRDRGKRPLMGAVAAQRADVVVVTSDNPRSEDPAAIVGEILEGVIAQKAGGPDAALVDRTEAIHFALDAARPGDVVLIAGKGHETGQEFADRTIPFDDRVVAAAALTELGWEGSL